MFYANAKATGIPITTSTSSARGTLPASTGVFFVVVNDSDSLAYVNFGDASVTATSANPAVAPNSYGIFQRNANTDVAVAILLGAGTGLASVYQVTPL